MSTLVQVTEPPWVAITPCAASPEALMVTPDRVTEAPLPVANAPFAPMPLVVMAPPVMLMVPADASTPALRP